MGIVVTVQERPFRILPAAKVLRKIRDRDSFSDAKTMAEFQTIFTCAPRFNVPLYRERREALNNFLKLITIIIDGLLKEGISKPWMT